MKYNPRYETDIVFFIEDALNLKLKDYQKTMLRLYETSNELFFYNARQIGTTTILIYIAIHYVLFNKESKIVFKNKSHTPNFHLEFYKILTKLQIEHTNRRELITIKGNGSKIYINKRVEKFLHYDMIIVDNFENFKGHKSLFHEINYSSNKYILTGGYLDNKEYLNIVYYPAITRFDGYYFYNTDRNNLSELKKIYDEVSLKNEFTFHGIHEENYILKEKIRRIKEYAGRI